MTRTCVVAAVVAALAGAARPAAAQSCGAQRSSCHGCHEEQGQHAVNDDGTPWHGDHALGDFCAPCHGGDPTAAEREAAHAGRVPPLAEARCTACHAEPAPLLARYTAARAQQVPRAPGEPAPPAAIAARGSLADVVAAALAALLALGGAVGIARRERRLRGAALGSLGRTLVRGVCAPAWSPLGAGAALGGVITLSLGLGHRLSGSAAYQQLGGAIGRRLAPDSVYWTHVMPPLAMTWELWAWLGAILGAFLSARASGAFRLRTMPDRGWREVHGDRVALRWALAYVGSVLTGFAAGIAGGCTASLAMSGGAVLVPAAFVFMAGMFAGGIPTAAFVARRGGAR